MVADIAFRIVSRLVRLVNLTPICASYRAWIWNGVSQTISHVRIGDNTFFRLPLFYDVASLSPDQINARHRLFSLQWQWL
jgi:hypothetical protein